MFAAHCEAEGRTVLLSTRRITDLRVEPDRVTISFTCWCGHEGQVVDHRSPTATTTARPEEARTPEALGRPTADAPPATAETRHRVPDHAAA